jgi:hypothetical protein
MSKNENPDNTVCINKNIVDEREELINCYRGWLQYIADISFGRDGCKSEKALGELVDELHQYALAGLRDEFSQFPPDVKYDENYFQGYVVAGDCEEGSLKIQMTKEWFDSHEIVIGKPCTIGNVRLKRNNWHSEKID